MDCESNTNGLKLRLRRMPSKTVVWKHIDDISPTTTSHGVGEKRVLTTQAEIGNPITQIAHTLLRVNEKVDLHKHPTMDEHFFFLDGECTITVEESKYLCKGGDYLYVPAGHEHEVLVIKDTTIITIGISYEE